MHWRGLTTVGSDKVRGHGHHQVFIFTNLLWLLLLLLLRMDLKKAKVVGERGRSGGGRGCPGGGDSSGLDR